MFRPTISSTPLTLQMANTFFKNIGGEAFHNDVTFISTLRALVASRVNEGESVFVAFRNTSYPKSAIEGNTDRYVVDAIYNSHDYGEGSIIIHSFTGSASDNLAAFRVIERAFTSRNSGFERIVKVTEFFRKTFYSLCYVNPAERKVAIFVDNLNIRRMHYLQCSIFAFLPWYFDPNAGVTEDEMELIQSLRETTPERYMAAISKIASAYDFRSMHIRNSLKGFETMYEKHQCDSLRKSIQSYRRRIIDYNDQIANVLRTKNDAEIRLMGLEEKIARLDGEDSEIMEYFLCNKKLDLEYVNGSDLTFVVKDHLTYFDEDMAKTIIDNNNSYVYRHSRSFDREDVKKLMYAIFIDQVLKLRFCCAYTIRLGERVTGMRDYSYNESCDTYIPNPHIDRYSCLGNYERTMNERLMDNDAIGAIEQCISSCKSLNFSDSTVMEVFMDRMCGRDGYRHNKCIELPDGNIVDMKGAIEWMKAQERAAQETETPEEAQEETTAAEEQEPTEEVPVEETVDHIDEDEEIEDDLELLDEDELF